MISLEHVEDIYPLSPMQQGMLFHTLYAPDSGVYFEQIGCTIEGDINVEAFQDAWRRMLGRYAILRTAFLWEDIKEPHQVVFRSGDWPLGYMDWRALTEDEQRERLKAAMEADRARGFDLTSPPLMRWMLIRIADRRCHLVWSFHHILLDAWSGNLFLNEFFSFYRAFCEGSDLHPATSRPYRDYIAWLLQQDQPKAEHYWRMTLQGFKAPTSLGLARPADRSDASRDYDKQQVRLSASASREVQLFARKNQLTLNTMLQGAWALMLARYSGTDDVVFGATSAGRPTELSGAEAMIGLFINTLPVRVRVPNDGRLIEWLKDLQAQQAEARQYEYSSLIQIQKWSEVSPGQPLFESIHGLQNHQVDSWINRAGNLKIKDNWAFQRTNYPLTVLASPGPELLLEMWYECERFDSASISRMLMHYKTVLSEIANSTPDRRLGCLPLLTAAERRQLLVDWNDTRAEAAPLGAFVHTLFEQQAARTPDAVALIVNDSVVTYRDLNRRANQLAHTLRGGGVGPESLVAVFMERSVEMVIGLMGIFKAGAGYLPMDASYPRERLAFILEESGAPVVLTKESLAARLPKGGHQVICLDTDWAWIQRQPADNPRLMAKPENLAYVIYTSGSTGLPKGVMNSHRALVGHIAALADYYSLSPNDRILQIVSLSFDASAEEIFPPLIRGAALVLAPATREMTGADLLEICEQNAITILHLPTPLWHQWVNDLAESEALVPAFLRIVHVGGDQPSLDKLRVFARLLQSDASFVNAYGPTESTILTSLFDAQAGEAESLRFDKLPIGRPFINRQIYILGPSFEPLPVGVPGEMYIGGSGLARGYFQRPDLTAERFLPNPFSGESPARVYRTGDLARYFPDGNIEFLGRADHQIKIRGFRIEIEEIESALMGHEEVQEAAVVAAESDSGDKHLIGYVVGRASAEIAQDASRDLLTEQVAQWQTVFDDTYLNETNRSQQNGLPATFNIVGWNSSYTGQPLPPEEMREWVDHTVERIASLKYQRILEIGCGTGLLLFNLAPLCSEYVGTDFSGEALAYVHRHLDALGDQKRKVVLLRRAADELSEFVAERFDCVIINSVAQYFPSIDYLVRVLQGAVDVVKEGGAIFIGDLRSLPLLKTFYLSVEMRRAEPGLQIDQLRENVRKRLFVDNELAIDPEFFVALKDRLARIGGVEISLKRGRYHNELTRFRYDVLLRIGGQSRAAPEILWHDWTRDGFTLEGLRERLAEQEPALLAIEGIPNERVIEDVRALALLDTEARPKPAESIRQAAASGERGIDPETLWRIEEDLPYSVQVSWLNCPGDGSYRALFVRKSDNGRPAVFCLDSLVPAQADPPGSWQVFASFPMQDAFSRKLSPRLLAFLKERLPDYMIPSVFLFLDKLPLTSNGKVDRKALLSYGTAPLAEGESEGPRTPVEEIVAGLWADVLRLERVGIHQNFFAMGGHSLLATRVISRIRDSIGVEIPLRVLFETPTVAGVAEAIEREHQAAHQQAEVPPIRPANRDGKLPLSFAQQRLWFLQQLEPDSTAYNVPVAVRLRGRLSLAALHQSLQEIVRRHEALRTKFAVCDGQPVQLIVASAALDIGVVDLTALSPAAQEPEVRRRAVIEASLPFDLSCGPLLRVKLLRQAEQEHALLVTLHHIIADAWSRDVLVRELIQLYEAFYQGQPSPLRELPIQYADYAVWQRQRFQGEPLEQELDYWREELSDATQALEFPTDFARPAVQSHRGAQLRFRLSQATAARFNEFSQREGVTLFMALLAAFQALLFRYSGQADIVVGTPIANRTRSETEGLIGFFVNTLALRVKLEGHPTWRELLRRVRETALGAYAHQHLPFEKLVEELQPERDLARSPLFQVMLVLQKAPADELRLSGLSLSSISTGTSTSKFDLTLLLDESREGLHGVLEYGTDLFEQATIARMAEHYQRLLEAMIAQPTRPIAQVQMLTEQEQQQLLLEWNASHQHYSGDQSLQELFDDQVKRAPDGIAVQFEQEQISYAELKDRANHLARHLRRLGVGPEEVVGLCVGRSVEMIICVLGIIKSGAAYLPLDSSYPEERLRFMAEDAGIRILIVDPTTRDRFAPALSNILDSSTLWRDLDEPPSDAVTSDLAQGWISPDSPIYLIYTSGSTGMPKGVVMVQRALLNLMRWQIDQPGFAPSSRTLQYAPLSFDVSFQEIFSTWLTGGTLVVTAGWVRRDMEELLEVLAQQAIERLFLPYVALKHLSMTWESSGRPRLAVREVITAGEQLQIIDSIRDWLRSIRDGALYNQYGPSESHVVTAYELLPRAANEWPVLPPIGKAIANARIYVLDEEGLPVAPGLPGELCIGGVSLGRGYWRHPELTADRFRPDSYSGEPGRRMYKTGDLARRLIDGELAFIGRADNQVKIRGFRVELAEIEAALSEHAGVTEAVVIVKENGPGEKRLVAYLVWAEEAKADVEEVRRYLKQRLPEYMLPVFYVALEKMPLTPSGKVNRRALPEPENLWSQENQNRQAPCTPLEELLQGIWKDVLKLEEVGLDRNFFELGGHSLLATQVISRVRDVLGVEVPIRALFESPTIAELAVALQQQRHAGSRVEAPPIRRAGQAQELPLSFAQQRLWFIHQLDPESAAYHLPTALRLQGMLDIPALRQSLQEIVRRHEALRTRFDIREGMPIQVIDEVADVVVPLFDLSSLAESERKRQARDLAVEQIKEPFNLEHGMLWRARLIRLSAEDHILLLCLHHIASDGWSTGVLVKEVSALYEAYREGRSVVLPDLPVQYADYAVWQNQLWETGGFEAQLQYWREQLNAAALLDLPTDHPRLRMASGRGEVVSLKLPTELTAGLRELNRREGVTFFMTLLAAFNVVLARYSGQEDIVVGTDVANRNRIETEGLIGFFVNQLVLRTDLSGNPSLGDVLRRVRETTLDAYAHQDFPFEKLVAEFTSERDMSRSPLFQVKLDFKNTPQAELKLSGLEVSEFRADLGTAKSDLTLLFVEAEDAVSAAAEYATDIYDRSTVERLLKHLCMVGEMMVADVSQPFSAIALLSDSERRQVLVEWNQTTRDDGDASCLHEAFAAQARRTPDAPAVVCGDCVLSYRALNEEANRLANYLGSLGVETETRVALCLERNVETVIAVLGVLKAGGTYVPLDTSNPVERLAVMLEDSQAPVVLTQERLLLRLPASRALVVSLDGERSEWAGESCRDTGIKVDPQNLAYMIYTSGSTGRPKGVMVTHAGLCNYLKWASAAYLTDESSGSLVYSSISFDLTLTGLLVPLLWGAEVELIDETETVGALQKTVERSDGHRLVKLTPGALELIRSLLPHNHASRFATILVIGGEALSWQQLEYWRMNASRMRLVNEYGPTETVVGCCVYEAPAEGAFDGPVPIGKPIANMRTYVVDRWGLPASIGAAGELYVAGVGLARGYLGEPELTAERFLPDAMSGEAGGRLYRTGDRVKWRADGDLEYLGRLDQQIKIRGYRIEPGEIQSVLARCADVQQCAICVWEREPGEKRLVAYVVAAQQAVPSSEDLRNYLQDKLPEYMVPSAFVVLPELPFTANGKLDRSALPPPALVATDGESEAPRTEVETILADVWCEMLRLDRVGIRRNFFDLGGHSLLSVRLMMQIEKRLGVQLPVSQLFLTPTIEQLAAVLQDQSGQLTSSPLVRIRGTGARPPFFCVHPILGSVFRYGNLARELDAEQPFYGLEARGLHQNEAPLTTMEEMAACYIEAIRDVQPEGPYYIGGWSFGGVVAFEMSRQLSKEGHEVGLLAVIDTFLGEFKKPQDERAARSYFGYCLARQYAAGVTLPADESLMDEDRFLNCIASQAHALGLSNGDLDISWIRKLFGVFRSNLLAYERYIPRPFGGSVTLFRAEDSGRQEVADWDSTWRRLALRGLDVHVIGGDHYSMLEGSSVRSLARKLEFCLRQAQGARQHV